jgi:phosphoribosylformylglycinamidine cyclo-ligase
MTYKSSGVDILAANRLINKAKPYIQNTFDKNVIGGIGSFAGFYRLGRDYSDPVLVSCTDGVGTKLKIAFLANKHSTVGIDLVAMCVNDLIAQGARPMFFLDYLATGKLHNKVLFEVLKGIVDGCKEAGCALIGGETAELPGFYKNGEYDLAGFTVGVVERKKIIDGSRIKAGDLHSNGYSLARKVLLGRRGFKPNRFVKILGKTVAGELLKPTKIYCRLVLKLLEKHDIKGIAHITGGGFIENIPRIIPDNCQAFIDKKWDIPPVFSLIQERGKIEEREMFLTFNMGIGMVLVVSPEVSDKIRRDIKRLGEKSFLLGEVVKQRKGQKKQKINIQGVS